jgi:small subunit ribosomal protein S17
MENESQVMAVSAPGPVTKPLPGKPRLSGLCRGVVVSDKRDKTITVEVRSRVKHARYGKFLVQKNRFHAHDEKEEAKVGDTVLICRTRPLSKQKRWRLVRVLESAVAAALPTPEEALPGAPPRERLEVQDLSGTASPNPAEPSVT